MCMSYCYENNSDFDDLCDIYHRNAAMERRELIIRKINYLRDVIEDPTERDVRYEKSWEYLMVDESEMREFMRYNPFHFYLDSESSEQDSYGDFI